MATSSLAMALASLYYATYSVRSQWLGRTYWHGRRDSNAVALTFDDGPSPDTERILDVLAEHHLSAAFFMVGRQVESFPGIARRVFAEGHEVGNHSYSHPLCLFQPARPPYGVRTPAYFGATRALDLHTVQWDVAGFDWKAHSPSQIADSVLRKVRAGSIILLHDGDSAGKQNRKNTVQALPLIIKGLRERDLQIAPLSRLLPEEIYDPTKGKRLND